MLVVWSSRPLRSLASLAALLGAFTAGGCAYQLNSLAAKSGADTEQTGLTGRPPEVDLAYARAVAANAFARGGKDTSTPFHRSVIHAGTEFESRMSDLFASLPARIGDSGY
jgi:hypothetical protein